MSRGKRQKAGADKDQEAILNRRAFLIRSLVAGAAAGAGAMIAGCKRKPQICLTPLVPPEPPPPGPDPQVCLEVEPQKCLSLDTPDANDAPEPQECLRIAPETEPKETPKPCLSMPSRP
jgi:hypothetical protein